MKTKLPKIKMGNIIFRILRLILLVGICYLFLFPILYIVSLAVRDPSTVNDPSIIWLPKELSLSSIGKAFELMKYGEGFLLRFPKSSEPDKLTEFKCLQNTC